MNVLEKRKEFYARVKELFLFNSYKTNLNTRYPISINGEYDKSYRHEYLTVTTSYPQYHFTDIKDKILNLINIYPVVLGCVYRLTDLDILDLLTKKQIVQLVLNDDDVLKQEDNSWKKYLHDRYKTLIDCNNGFNESINMSKYFLDICYVNNTGARQPVILSPLRKISSNSDSMMHHKFLLFCDNDKNFTPKILLTGSFNLTSNATNSYENIIIDNNSNALNAFCKEFKYCLLMSKQITASYNEIKRESSILFTNDYVSSQIP